MTRTSRVHVSLPMVVAVVAIQTPAHAQGRQEDMQVWGAVSGTVDVGAKLEARVDTLATFDLRRGRPVRQLARLMVVAPVTTKLRIGGGVVGTHFRTGVTDANEQRFVEEVDYRTTSGSGIGFRSRTQLEQRRREGERGLSWRLRQMTRLQIKAVGTTSVVGWNETFVELAPTSWAGRTGPSLIINFLGTHIPLSSRLSLEPGYLNQTLFVRGRNPVVHAAALFVQLRL